MTTRNLLVHNNNSRLHKAKLLYDIMKFTMNSCLHDVEQYNKYRQIFAAPDMLYVVTYWNSTGSCERHQIIVGVTLNICENSINYFRGY